MRRATFISVAFHAAIAAAAIAAGMMNAHQLPVIDGGIPVSLVAAAPDIKDTGVAGYGSPEPPAPAAPAAAPHTPRQTPTPPTSPETAETVPVPPRLFPLERTEIAELPPEPAEPPPPEPVVTPPEPKPEPPVEVVAPAEPEPPVEPTPVEPTPVKAAVTPVETAPATTATSTSTEGVADNVQIAHADTGAEGLPTDDSGTFGSEGSGTAADPAIVADYAALLAQWLERHKEYPERAQRRNQEGVVLCEFTITDTGDVMNYRILEGSGHDLLDEEVNALIARASPLPPPPPGAAATYRVPIVFALR
ncbi:MAG: TonB family protein [Dongiaceae bacterium]